MAKIKNKHFEDFFFELRFTPKRQKLNQLLACIDFLGIIEPDTEYPLEFICFKITDYRPKTGSLHVMITGAELADDLRVVISILSSQVDLAVTDYDQPVFSIAQLAKKFSVSTKTIQRWRKIGLLAWTFVYPDGKKRIGIPASYLDDFLESNPKVKERSGNFSKLSNNEKQRIIDLAAEYGPTLNVSRHKVYQRVAREVSRAVETIRYTIVHYEQANPEVKFFSKPAGTIDPKSAALLYKMYRQGVAVKELSDHFHRSRSSVHRIINKRRNRALQHAKLEYIDSSEFLDEKTAVMILPESLDFSEIKKDKSGYLLNKQQEVELFRRYNYLKYLVCTERVKIDPVNPSGRLLENVEGYLGNIEQLKTILIEANLRLVISIANKHKAAGVNFAELVSEGNFSLMHAVEKFDYTRGYRFSTYASWAIAKEFARKIPDDASRPDRAATADMSNIDQDMRNINVIDIDTVERVHTSLDLIIQDNLTEREQYVVRSHFGLYGNRITTKKKTLKDIGDTLGLSRERVRQIELVALQQLRHCLSPEEFDLLTR